MGASGSIVIPIGQVRGLAAELADLQSQIDGITGASIPDQTGNSGKYLTTDGSVTSWSTVSASVAWGDVTGTLSNQTDLQSALNAKAASSHSHIIADTTGLQTALDAKLATGLAVLLAGSYADPSWITSLAKSKVGLGSVENTALSTWAGTSNITTIGTLSTLTIASGSPSMTIAPNAIAANDTLAITGSATSSSAPVVTIKGQSGLTAEFIKCMDNADAEMATIDADGRFTGAGVTLTSQTTSTEVVRVINKASQTASPQQQYASDNSTLQYEVDENGNVAANKLTSAKTVAGGVVNLGATLSGATASNCDNGHLHYGTATGDITISNPTGTPTDGQAITYRILASGGTRTITLDTAFDTSFISGYAAAAPATGKYAMIGAVWCASASKWQVTGKLVQA